MLTPVFLPGHEPSYADKTSPFEDVDVKNCVSHAKPLRWRPPAWTLKDAKARFSEVMRRASERGPQRITKRGQDAVVVLSTADYARVAPAAAKPTLFALIADSPFASLGSFDEPLVQEKALVRKAEARGEAACCSSVCGCPARMCPASCLTPAGGSAGDMDGKSAGLELSPLGWNSGCGVMKPRHIKLGGKG